MELSNGRKAFYIAASVLFSFVIWFYVNNASTVDLKIEKIPVEFFNAESALANKGLVLVSGGDATVDLVLSMPRSMVYSFNTERVRLLADLSSVNSTGTQSLRYTIIYPVGINPSQIAVKSPAVQTVSIRVGELFRKNDVEIRCKLVGNLADGYVAGRVRLLPETLEIWGQQSDVMKVSYAQVTLNIQNARKTIVEQLDYTLYDYNDEPIENSSVRSASSSVSVTMPVISATDIPLSVRFIESPGIRIDSFDYKLDRKSVTLSGDANLIAELGEIVLGEVVLAEIGDEQTITYDIPIPEGVTNLSGATTATLTISNRDVTTKDVTVTSFDYENFTAVDRSVEVVTSSLNVTLRGKRADLEAINEDSLRAVADLSGVIDASGTYTVPANLRIEGDPDVGTVNGYLLTVRIGSIVPPAPAEGQDGDTGAGQNAGTNEGPGGGSEHDADRNG